ncbi:UDP-N-acetylglucosamine 1-carboxyvinyltransferase, partial [Leptospira borgpetersenii serovar Hardjo-bovis]|nr:UDP-N-acetylglucosamine 1-carboxyvinyltransferase [Leptospira borgpetersenii serovar Hardjo-bovis]
ACLINRGRTVLRGIAHIEEVNRILEVLTSIGVTYEWSDDEHDLTLIRPAELNLDDMDIEAARRTRSVIMFLGPLMRFYDTFKRPYAGGCNLGARTVEPHLQVLRAFGLDVVATEGFYQCHVTDHTVKERHIVLTERGDTVTENALLAAAQT